MHDPGRVIPERFRKDDLGFRCARDTINGFYTSKIRIAVSSDCIGSRPFAGEYSCAT